MTFTISAPPYKKMGVTVQKIMLSKVFALIPVILISIYMFGLPALGIVLVSVLAAVATEAGIQKAFDQKITIGDGHAVFIGITLALILPPDVPLWLPAVGSFFAVAVVKHAFGGIGSYVFNPTLGAWIFLTLAWTQIMTPVSTPHIGQLSDLILENGAGFLIGVSPLALIGGVYLMYKKYIDWRVPLSYFVTAVLLVILLKDDISYLITGAFLFGVMFLASDMATSPVTKKGRIIYGIVCGILTVLYGYFANYVFAVFYGIFLANCLSPLIENNTLPKPFGGVKK